MTTIKFNNTEFEVESFSKNTSFGMGTIVSTASCSLITEDIDDLNTLAQNTITSIQIYFENALIYNSQNIEAHIDSIGEYLSGSHISVSVNLTFNI